MLGVARRDVPGRAFAEAELSEEPEGGGQALLAVPALVGHVGETAGRWWDTVGRPSRPV